MLHVTCADASTEELKSVLSAARSVGIRNILALRGDAKRAETGDCDVLHYAVDLVRLIRREHGDYFSIAVAGYPHGHPESPRCVCLLLPLLHTRCSVPAM